MPKEPDYQLIERYLGTIGMYSGCFHLLVAGGLTFANSPLQFEVAFKCLKRYLRIMFKTKNINLVGSAAERRYRSNEVSRIAGISLRQLQWWDERKVVSPRQDAHKRVYMAEELVEISVIAELRRKGFSLQKIRRVLKYLQKEMGRRLADVFTSESEIHLLTDGKSIYLEDSPDRIIDLLKGARQPMFLVCITDQVRRLTPPPVHKPAKSETLYKKGASTAKTRMVQRRQHWR